MKRTLLVVALLTLAAGGTFAYQVAVRDRDYRALLARGDAALREEQPFGAIEAYSGAIALRPDAMLPHLRRGETYLGRGDRGDLDQAARDFRTAATLDPTAPRPLEELGDALFQLERYEEAAESFSRCLQVDDRRAQVSYKLALTQYRLHDSTAAIATLTQTLRLDPQMVNAHYLLGICLRDQERGPEAQAAFEKAVSVSPGFIAAREELADLYRAGARSADELEQLQIIAGLDRGHVERQVAVGLAQARAGHPDLAVLTLGNALERTPDQPLIYGALGQVWLTIAEARNDQVDLGKALEALGRVASSPGATSESLTLYGRALLRDGQAELAERTLQQAAGRYPIEPGALLWYSTAAERLGHWDIARRALIDYGGVIGDDPDAGSRAMRIGNFSLRLNDPATAAEWFGRAADAAPNDLQTLASLADAQLKSGDRDAARATVARGLEKDAKHPLMVALARRLR